MNLKNKNKVSDGEPSPQLNDEPSQQLNGELSQLLKDEPSLNKKDGGEPSGTTKQLPETMVATETQGPHTKAFLEE